MLLSSLIIFLYKSPYYFTKATLMQLLVSTWGITISSIPSLLIYGNDLKTSGYRSSICIIQQKFAFFFFYPLHFFFVSLVICLYKGAVKKYLLIEQDWFWYYSCVIWCFSACLSVFSFAVDIEDSNYGTIASSLVCKPIESRLHIFTYLIVSAPLLLLSLVYTIISSRLLLIRFKSFRQRQIRFTVMRLGHAIRLSLCGVCFTVFLLCTSVPRLISYFIQQNEPNFNSTILLTIYDYAFAVIGIIYFLLFGSQKTAVMFFNKCYYAPPENLTFKTSSYLRDDSFSRTRPPTTETSYMTELSPSDLPTLPASSLQVPPKLTSIPEESDNAESFEEGGSNSIRVTIDVRTEVFEEDTQHDYEIV